MRRLLSRHALQLILLLIIAVLSAAVFAVEGIATALDPIVVVLLDALQFAFAIALGAIIQRILSSEDYQKGLRQFALSAYRRISDIKFSVSRLIKEVEQRRVGYPENQVHELDLINAIAENLDRTVQSSVDDWVDIIGDEIVTVRKIEKLQDEVRVASAIDDQVQDPVLEARLLELTTRINNLKSDLPLPLQSLLESSEDFRPRGGRSSPVVYANLVDSIRDTSSIRLLVHAYFDMSDQAVSDLKNGAPYRLWMDYDMGSEHLGLQDFNVSDLGEVVNPFEDTGVYHKDYFATLLPMLPLLKDGVPGGMSLGTIEGSEFAGLAPEDGHFYVRIPFSDEMRERLTGAK